jgi:hypothetical protein
MLQLGSTIVAEQPAKRKIDVEIEVDQRSLSTAELAECTCPDFCERDHETD